MPKNILIINSNQDKTVPLSGFFKKLAQNNHKLFLLSAQSGLLDFFKQNKWSCKKRLFGPAPDNNFKAIVFAAAIPILIAVYSFNLICRKYKKNISAVICMGYNDKIIISLIAGLLKLKIIWLELPNADYNHLPKFFAALYKFSSKRAIIVVFNSFSKTRLSLLGISENQIVKIPFGIELNQYKFQENIFNELAQTKNIAKKKYFTVGAAVDLNSQQNLKSLFGAVKICANIIPDIQLVIIGDGNKRKDLIWLAKKMEIENYVWFVGKQNHLRKWLNNFNIYAAASEKPGLTDYKINLKAMSASLPIIGVSNLGLEDFIESEGRPCGILTDNGNNEELAQSIIKLWQNERLRMEMGENGREKVEKYFSLDKMVEEFEKILC